MHYLKHAWEATHSVWGKSCIVLFYLFIWLQIIWAIQLVIAPKKGWECYYEGVHSDYAAEFILVYLRGMNVITVGFYLYADRGGIKVWNVATVFIINAIWTLVTATPVKHAMELDGSPDCDSNGMITGLW